MKTTHKLVLAMLLGAALGAAAMYAREAKAPKGYIVSELEVTNPAMFQQYLDKVPATLAPFHGQFIIRGGKTEAVEGEPAKRFVVIAFDSMKTAHNWEYSPAYEAIKPLRHNSSKSRLFIAEGVTP